MAQKDTITTTNPNKFYFTVHVGFGSLIAKDKKGFSSFVMIQFQNKKLWGFGSSMANVSFKSIPYDENPPSESIRDYNPATDAPFSRIRLNGFTGDSFDMYALFVSKGYKINNRFIIDFQIGPSLVGTREYDYSYSYSPGSASSLLIPGGPPTLVVNTESSVTTLIYGTLVRANFQARFASRTVLELSPFLNVNKKRSFFGINLGIVFGRGYKEKVFQPE
jgi:hypothetical protein